MITEEQAIELFNSVDTNKNGVIELNEFITAFKKQFPNVPEFALAGLFRMQDINGDGTLDFLEFFTLIRFLEKHPTNDPFELMFYQCDFDGNKKLDTSVPFTPKIWCFSLFNWFGICFGSC